MGLWTLLIHSSSQCAVCRDTTLSPGSPWGDILFYSLGALAAPEPRLC